MWLGRTPPLGVNDGVGTREGAYFTDSLKPFLYRVPIAPSGTLGMISQAIPHVGDVSEPRVLRTRVGFQVCGDCPLALGEAWSVYRSG